MKRIFTIASVLFALSYSAEGQNNIVYGAGVSYTNGTPTYNPGARGAQIAIDTVTGYWYEYRTETSAWVHAGYRIQTIAGCAAPGYVPGKKQSLLVVNACDSLYYYRSSAWRHLNPTGGGDPSITNEGILGVGAGASNTSVITSNTSTAVGVTITAAGINTISETTSSNGGNITITGTEVDGSTTNELQTIANTSDVTSHTVTLSNSGGSVQIIEGTGIGLSTGGTGLDGTTTITNTAPDQTVSITGAGISVVTGTYPNFTVTSTEVDGSVTNEGSQTVGAGGANTSTIVSNTSGSTPVTVSGSNTILVTESGSTITLQADTSLLATVNDLNTRLIVDTVNDYTALRAYSSTAPIVFVRKNGIQGFFKAVTGGWVDDGGITIVGTKKFRRITENLRIVNVRWFGAVADSLTDDNTAIQAALDWCLDSVSGIGTTLYFPAGKYRYTSQIYAYKPKNIAIAGDGMHNTYLFPVNVNGIYFRADSTAIVGSGVYGNTEMRDFGIRDLTMIRSGSNSFASKLIGIYLLGGINMRVERVRVEEFFATSGGGIGSMGIKLDVSTTLTNDVTQHTTLSDVWVSQCDTGIVTHLNNTMLWHNVQVDQCKDFGVVLGNGVFWNEGMIQGCENGGLWLQKNSSDVISNVHVNHVYFEQNSYVSPKYGFVYKADNTDATNVVFQNCGFSSSANTRIFNLKRITAGAFVNNKYLISSTDTIWLQSMSNIQFGNDNYESATLITSDCNITWLNGLSGSVNSVTGLSLSTPEPGPNVLNVNAGIAVGPTYYNITAPTSGAIIEGDVGIKNSSPTQALHVTGNARVTGAIYDSNNQAGTSGQVLSSTVTGTDWITNTSGGGPDSTWAKSVGGGYANKRITDPVYRSSAARINMAADSAALTLKYHSAQTAPIFDIERSDGTTVAYAHVYNETGSNPTLVFGKAGTVSASSSNNTVFGLTSGLFSAGAGDNTLIGARAGNSLNGGYENTFVGSRAGQSITSGGQNAGFGYSALQNIQNGGQNMAIGRRALNSLTSASRNTAVGSDALRLITTTADNVAIGTQAGDSCVGSNNVYIGSAAGRRSKGSGNILIGYSAGENQGNVSNQLYIENTNSTTPLIAGDFSANRAGINTAPGSLVRDFHVTGEVRITDLATDTPTRLVGADADGDLDTIGIGAEGELHITSGALGTNFHTTISPAQLTAGMTNNWNPTGLSTAWIIRIDADGKFEMITGIVAPTFNKPLRLWNVSANAILFPAENQSSTAANRFSFGRDVVLFPGKCIEIQYDLTSTRWRLISVAGIYDDVQHLYFNEAFNAPVSGTSGEWSFWDIVSAGSVSATAPVAGRWSGISVSTGSSATGSGYVASKDVFFENDNTSGTANWAYCKAVIKTPASLSDASNDYTVRIGFNAQVAGGGATDGIYIDYNHATHSGNWSCATTNAGNTQRNNSGVAVAASTNYVLEVVFRPNLSAEFFINGTRVATNDTFVPASTGDDFVVMSEIEKSVGTTSRDITVYTLQTSIALVK
jgi:hypothetical protein